MASQPTPEEIRRVEFRSALRGIDRAEVVEYLDAVASRIEHLEAETQQFGQQITQTDPALHKPLPPDKLIVKIDLHLRKPLYFQTH